MSVAYQIVYDAGSAAFRFPREALFGLIPLAAGLLIARFPSAWFGPRLRLGRMFAIGVGGFGVLFLVGIPLGIYSAHARLRRALAAHTFTVVEGVVADFTLGSPTGHPMESFAVAGRRYSYSPYTRTGFNHISTQGGPVRPGARVRIADVQGNIARLEIAR